MNVLIVSDKSDEKNYKTIIKSAPNTSVLGTVTSIDSKFITDIKEKYHPHAIVIDTSVPVKKTSIYNVINDIHRIYPYIKVVVLTDEDDNTDYPAFAVVKGQITNVEFNGIIKQAQDDIEKAEFQQLPNSTGEETHNNPTVDLSGAGKTTKLYRKQSENNVDNLFNLKIKIPNVKPSRKNRKSSDKTLIFIAIVAIAVIAVVITILVLVKSYNINTDVATNDEVTDIVVTTVNISTTEPIPTEEELIVSFTDSPSSENIDVISPDKKTEKSESETPKADNKDENSSSKSSNSSSSSKSNSSSKVNNSSSSQSSNKSEASISYDTDRYNNSGNNTVSSISLSYKSKTLKVGEYISIKATTYPKSKTVSWSSNNSYVATVNSSGKVTAHNVGTAIITASADGIKSNCTITVNPKPTEAQKTTVAPTTKDPVKLSVTSQSIVVGQIISINLEQSSGCSWKITNPSVVQICGGGSNKITVKGIKSGSTEITATNTKTGKTYTCKITVN